MIKAREARTLTNKAIEEDIATRRERAEQFCDALVPQIQEVCASMMSELRVADIPKGLYSYVLGILKDSGYYVSELDKSTVYITW